MRRNYTHGTTPIEKMQLAQLLLFPKPHHKLKIVDACS